MEADRKHKNGVGVLLRQKFKKVASILQEMRDTRVTIADVLRICQSVKPSKLFDNGGDLLDTFATMSASKRELVIINKKLNGSLPTVESTQYEEITASMKKKFYPWLLQHAYMVNQLCAHHLCFLQLASEWRGLSRNGRALQHTMSVSPSIRTYDRFKIQLRQKQADIVKAIMMDANHVRVFDNFNRNYGINFVESTDEAYHSNNWCVQALSVLWKPSPMDFKYSVDGSVVPPHPLKLFDDNIATGLIKHISELCSVNKRKQYISSLMVTMNVNNIPIKPVIPDIPGTENIKAILAESRDGLEKLVTFRIDDKNPGSNDGLYEILMNIRDEYRPLEEKKKYWCIRADQNIYHRYIMVRYNPLLSRIHGLDYGCMVLEFWHTFKQCAQMVVRHQSMFPTWIGPILHAFHPKDNVYSSMKLSKALMVTTILKNAYPAISRELQGAIDQTHSLAIRCDSLLSKADTGMSPVEVKRVKDKSAQWKAIRIHLLNLQDFCEFIIPSIHDYAIRNKMGQYGHSMNILKRLIIITHSFGSRTYTTDIFLHMLHMRHLQTVGHPLHTVISENLWNFMAEDIEIANSFLSAYTSSTAMRSDVEAVNGFWQLLPLYRSVTRDFDRELISGPEFKPDNHHVIDPLGDAVKTVIAHLRDQIKLCKLGTWKHYNMHSKQTQFSSRDDETKSAVLSLGTKRTIPTSDAFETSLKKSYERMKLNFSNPRKAAEVANDWKSVSNRRHADTKSKVRQDCAIRRLTGEESEADEVRVHSRNMLPPKFILF